jgi:hypothetical protein
MKNFVQAMNKHGKVFEYLREKFLKLSNDKLKKKGIFIGPQIREIINDDLSEHLLAETEKSEWLMFKVVCLNFFGNEKSRKLRGTC